MKTVFACALALITLGHAQELKLDKTEYRVGENIVAHWKGVSGNPKDWVGIYSVPGNAPVGGASKGPSTLWQYCDGKASGTLLFSKPGLDPGKYVAYLLATDGYRSLVKPVEFRILPSAGGTPRFLVRSIPLRHAVTGEKYRARISAYAANAETFVKVEGPKWLNVSADGEVTGTPTAADTGKVRVAVEAKSGTRTAKTTLQFTVYPAGKERVDSLSVLSYNVWVGLGGVKEGLRKGVESIVLANVDMVGIVEPGKTPQQLGERLGWYYDAAGFISKYPFEKVSGGSGYSLYRVRVAQSPRKELLVAVCHFDYQHYVPYVAQKKGSTTEMLLAEENTSQRPRQYREFVAGTQRYLDQADETPIVVMGDFNTASHLDWTEGNRANHYGHALRFPGSVLFEQAGLVDTFRFLHPDPARDPGVTWSPIYQGDEPQDRIDFIYAKGKHLKPRESKVYVTKVENVASSWLVTGNGATAAVRENTWPSDHAAVLTRFKW